MTIKRLHSKAIENNKAIPPKPTWEREANYQNQTGRSDLTPRQQRRLRHKENRMSRER